MYWNGFSNKITIAYGKPHRIKELGGDKESHSRDSYPKLPRYETMLTIVSLR
jgi:hypothetical protein